MPLLERNALGRWTSPASFLVTHDAIVEYAHATNDEETAHRAGRTAPLAFSTVPVLEVLTTASHFFAPEEVFAQALHRAQDIHSVACLKPGTTVHTRAAGFGISVRPNGTTLVLVSETRSDSGTLINTQYMSLIFPGVTDGESVGEVPPTQRLEAIESAPTRIIEYTIDTDQPTRFADASGDRNPMHLDRRYAKAAGYADVLVHGLCTMALCGRAVIAAACPGHPERLARLAVRFSRPVFPGQIMTTAVRPATPIGGRETLLFESSVDVGLTVVRDGLAVLHGRTE